MPIIDEKPLTPSERTNCDYLDSMIEGRIRSAKAGSWVEVLFPKQKQLKNGKFADLNDILTGVE